MMSRDDRSVMSRDDQFSTYSDANDARLQEFDNRLAANEIANIRSFWKKYNVKSSKAGHEKIELIGRYCRPASRSGGRKKKIDQNDLTRAREVLGHERLLDATPPSPKRSTKPTSTRRQKRAQTARPAYRTYREKKNYFNTQQMVDRLYPKPSSNGILYSKIERNHRRHMKRMDHGLGKEMRNAEWVSMQLHAKERELLFTCKQCERFLPRSSYPGFILADCEFLCAHCLVNPPSPKEERKTTEWADTYDLLRLIKSKRGGGDNDDDDVAFSVISGMHEPPRSDEPEPEPIAASPRTRRQSIKEPVPVQKQRSPRSPSPMPPTGPAPPKMRRASTSSTSWGKIFEY